MRAESAKGFPRWHQACGCTQDAAKRLLTVSVNHQFKKIKRPESVDFKANKLEFGGWVAGTACIDQAPGVHVSNDKGFVDLCSVCSVRGHKLVTVLAPDTKKQIMTNRNRQCFILTATQLIACVGLYTELVAAAEASIAAVFSPRPFPVEKVDNLEVRALAQFFAEVGVSLQMVADAWPWAMQCVMFLESTLTEDEQREWEFILRSVPERLVVFGMPPKSEGALAYWLPDLLGWPAINLAFYRWRRVLTRQRELDDKAQQTKTRGGKDVVMADTIAVSADLEGASDNVPDKSSPIESE